MSVVELHVYDNMLTTFDGMRRLIGGQEVGRRPSPEQPDVTIINMEMPNAPAGATAMDVHFRKVYDEATGETTTSIYATTWYDTDGRQISHAPQDPP